ncbi:hypothetical protein EDD80_101643 [Anseongella ginsenosidimutans]|uniref:Uncharacterized protein n=2 Tax=Anseongella ginsenosidimutans TaxID=496056 RepID=A0A4R3L1Y2_9SPHI|nr:hypothetical protein EDD80_101643 [Anseongella ginsenosidimutans]
MKDSAHQGTGKKASPLKSLEADLELYHDPIKEVSDEMLDAMLTRYPIFVAHQHEVKLGEIILDHRELGTQWTIQAATLEEFIEKKVVLPERKDYFEKSYKDPRKYMCLFVIVPEGANFVFYPYKPGGNS